MCRSLLNQVFSMLPFCGAVIAILTTVIGFFMMMISGFMGSVPSREYCDRVETTCNLSVIGNGDRTMEWYPVDYPVNTCRYKGSQDFSSGWKITGCYFDLEENDCPQDNCYISEKEKEEAKPIFYIGVGFSTGPFVLCVLGLLALCALVNIKKYYDESKVGKDDVQVEMHQSRLEEMQSEV